MKNIVLIALSFFSLLMMVVPSFAQEYDGLWEWRRKDGVPKYHVVVVEKNNRLYGRVTKTFSKQGVAIDKVCYQCPGSFNDRSIAGLTILKGPRRKSNGSFYGEKALFIPEQKRWFNCKIWRDGDDRVKVRVYEGLLFKTEVLYRVE